MLFTGGFEYGGAQRVLCNLANAFLKDNNEVIVVMASYAKPTYYLEKDIKLINGLNWYNYMDGVLKLRKCIRKENPDIIISFAVQYNIAACIATLGMRSKLIISERNDPKRMPAQFYLKLLRRIVYNFAQGYVFQTKDARDYFNCGIRKKSIIIPNPLYLSDDIHEYKDRPHKVISASRFVPQKNLDMLISAFSKAVDKNSDWCLDMFGDGNEMEHIKEMISQYSMEDRIHVFPATQSIHERMKEHAIFVLSSNFEGMPNSLMEAMGLGLVCISTDCPCGGPRYLINHGKNGFLVPVQATDELVYCLKKVMNDEKLREKVSKNALEIRKKLDPEIIMNLWMDYVLIISKS